MLVNLVKNLIALPKNILGATVGFGTKLLTRPREIYNPSQATNVRALKKRLKPGDVLLVSGNARISHVVKVLTLSQWSHVVLYAGDKSDMLSQEDQDHWIRKYGYQSIRHLAIDADPVRGIHLKPIDDYVGLMIRHCRAEALDEKDKEVVLDHALEQLGREYDVGHILRLLFFFGFPWELLPETLRRFITDFTLSEDDRICSRVLSEAFHSVGYPIRPEEVVQSRGEFHEVALGFASGLKKRSRSAVRLLTAGKLKKALNRITNKRYVIALRETRHITPADYDLSRFFTIIKDKDDLSIDYKKAKILCRLPD